VWFKNDLIRIYQLASPPALKAEPEPLTHLEQLRQRNLDDERAGKCITMNTLLRSIPKPRPPRRPSWARWE
jgi:hypothetical protein